MRTCQNIKETIYTYDANGSQITKATDEKTEANEYNAVNQLVGFTDGETTASYTYNADGLRASKTVDGETVKHVWDGAKQIIADVKNGAFYEADCYIRGTGLVAKYNYVNGAKSEYTYYTQNAHGDVVNLTDIDGIVIKTYKYDAFGVEKDIDDADTNAFRYCGEYYDKETATIYLRARHYNPNNGRFTQRDSVAGDINDPLSLNLYTYCHNNPIVNVDPSGHWPSLAKLAKAVVTVAVAAVVVVAVVATAGAAGAAVGVAAGMYFGASAATMATVATVATVGMYATAGGIAAMAAGDVQEIYSGTNFIRDGLMNGNQEMYDTTKLGLYAVATMGIAVGVDNKGLTTGGNKSKVSQNKTASSNGVGNPEKIAGRGSTGRTEPNSLFEQMSMHQVKSNPLKGANQLPIQLGDERWKSTSGWVKMESVVRSSDGITKSNIHFVYNKNTGVFDDFKFK